MEYEEIKDLLIDVFNYRTGTEEESDGSMTPIITAGSVTWGILLRGFVLIFVGIVVIAFTEMRELGWFIAFLVFALAVYPGFQQYRIFNERVKKVEENTICGKCRYFDESSQMCMPRDEHVTQLNIPCGGDDWELKN